MKVFVNLTHCIKLPGGGNVPPETMVGILPEIRSFVVVVIVAVVFPAFVNET